MYHNAGVNGGRELREFVDEHNNEALQMRLFVRFDTAGVAHFPEVWYLGRGLFGPGLDARVGARALKARPTRDFVASDA